MPGWGNAVLVISFSLFLTGAFMQAWVATHGDQAATAMRRAIRSYTEDQSGATETKRLQNLEDVIGAWQSPSAEKVARASGLVRNELVEKRRDLIRQIWSHDLENAAKQPADDALKQIEALNQMTAGEPDLQNLLKVGTEKWQAIRAVEINKNLELCRVATLRGDAKAAGDSLVRAEKFWLMKQSGLNDAGQFEGLLAESTASLAQKIGYIYEPYMTAKVFNVTEDARRITLPTISKAMNDKGYAAPTLASRQLSDTFRKNAAFRLVVEITERYGRGFEETPHRTTILEARLTLFRGSRAVTNQQATARTPRIPATTAMGMSRLQLSKQSDEKIERKLNEAAWEALPGALTQPLQLIPKVTRSGS